MLFECVCICLSVSVIHRILHSIGLSAVHMCVRFVHWNLNRNRIPTHPTISKSFNKCSLCMFQICIQIFWLAKISIKCAMVIPGEIELECVVLTLQMFIDEATKSVDYVYNIYIFMCVCVWVGVRVDDVTIKWWMYCRKCDTSIQWASSIPMCACG